jgi:SAM-dependent methyltransferase
MPYDQRYESDLLRGVEELRPWDLFQIIRKHTKKSDALLDIGCGTAAKLVKLAGDADKLYGLEPNEKMRKKAEENIKNAGISNITLVGGQAEKVPFADNYFDLVTCMVAPHDTAEVHRVLKPGGWAIVEKIGDREKWNLKQEFGSDEKGPRGQFSDMAEGERARIYEAEFNKLFSEVKVQSGSWKTYLTMKGLILLLEQTGTVRDFNKEADAEVLRRIQDKYSTPQGIETMQNRILIVAQK